MRADNPARGVRKYAEKKRERRLLETEYRQLGIALKNATAARVWPPAIAAVHFLAVTGWRSGEAIGLRWAEVNLKDRVARLTDTKTGASVRPLSNVACNIIMTLKHEGDLVFPASRRAVAMTGFRSFWEKIAELGPLPPDVTPHVLRHSFASLANDLGFSEPTIAALIGHKGHGTTLRYIHSADAVLLAAADTVGRRTETLLSGVASEEPRGPDKE